MRRGAGGPGPAPSGRASPGAPGGSPGRVGAHGPGSRAPAALGPSLPAGRTDADPLVQPGPGRVPGSAVWTLGGERLGVGSRWSRRKPGRPVDLPLRGAPTPRTSGGAPFAPRAPTPCGPRREVGVPRTHGAAWLLSGNFAAGGPGCCNGGRRALACPAQGQRSRVTRSALWRGK